MSVTADLKCGCPPVTLTHIWTLRDGRPYIDPDRLNLACLAHHLGTHPHEP